MHAFLSSFGFYVDIFHLSGDCSSGQNYDSPSGELYHNNKIFIPIIIPSSIIVLTRHIIMTEESISNTFKHNCSHANKITIIINLSIFVLSVLI